ncbi:MAG: hypothetical protein E7604_02120 [Ruminococcaceae bacterium]|nr:hypothetical protein [Oscillospiraceae bacterium]
MKKVTMLFASFLVLSSVLCACGDTGTTPVETGAQTGTQTTAAVDGEPQDILISDVLDESLDFGGKEVRFIVEMGWSGIDQMYRTLYAEEDTPDVVDSAVYQRNLAVQEALNVKIVEPKTVDPKSMIGAVEKVIRSGDDVYDAVAAYQAYSISGSALGYFLNYEDVPYVDYKQPYWATQYIDEMSYNGVYWVTGDITTLYTGGFIGTYVNKRLWDSIAPDDNIYDIVRDGKWTIDLMREYSQQVYLDLNNNGITDIPDQVGMAYAFIDMYTFGCGINYTSRDADGRPVLSLMTERTANIWEKLSHMIENTNGIMNINDYQNTPEYKDWGNHMGLYFAEGNCLFITNTLCYTFEELRDMKDDFYLIPCAKFDESQEQYLTQITDNCTIFGIPITSQNTESTGAVLEAMAIESYRVLRPAYYETALKEKYTRNEESSEMIDIIRSSITTDFGLIYGEAIGGGIGTSGSGLFRIFRTADTDGTDTITSLYEKNSKKYDSNFAELLDIFDAQASGT